MNRELRRMLWPQFVCAVGCLTGVITQALAGNWWAVLWAAVALGACLTTVVAIQRWLMWRRIAEKAVHAPPAISPN